MRCLQPCLLYLSTARCFFLESTNKILWSSDYNQDFERYQLQPMNVLVEDIMGEGADAVYAERVRPGGQMFNRIFFHLPNDDPGICCFHFLNTQSIAGWTLYDNRTGYEDCIVDLLPVYYEAGGLDNYLRPNRVSRVMLGGNYDIWRLSRPINDEMDSNTLGSAEYKFARNDGDTIDPGEVRLHPDQDAPLWEWQPAPGFVLGDRLSIRTNDPNFHLCSVVYEITA